MKKIFALAIAATFLFSGAAHAATLILDGDFTNTNAPFATITSPGSFGPWSVTSGSVDLIGTYWQAPSLSLNAGSVDLDGLAPGAIQQIFNAPAGNYVLSFSLSGNPDGGLGTKFLQVSVGSTTQNFSYVVGGGNTHSNMLYTPETLAFSTAGGPIALTFASLDETGPYGPVVGAASVSATPLPGSLLLFASGLAGLFFFARRRQGARI